MTEPSSRTEQLFYEVFESLPRQGPGNREATGRALAACQGLPDCPRILDLGCGVGAQTLDLAALTKGDIIAVDLHAPNIERLRDRIGVQGLSGRVTAEVGDFGALTLAPESFDLIWSEGALYNLGLEHALYVCHRLLRPGGCLAFTDAVWRSEDPPADARAMFERDYPAMSNVVSDVVRAKAAGFELLDHFTLPDSAWWEAFYTPMLHEIARLRDKYASDAESLAALDEVAAEPAMHEKFGCHYAYEFFVCRRPA